MKRQQRKRGRYVLLLILLLTIVPMMVTSTITPPQSVVVKKGDTIQAFFQNMGLIQRIRTRLYIAKNNIDVNKLQTGTYIFSGSYTPAQYIQMIMAGPTQDYIRYTILEGRSIYDIDADLTNKGLIAKGEFLSATATSSAPAKRATTYSFLNQQTPLVSLEGFMYPDTYFLGTHGSLVDQLINASLKRFREKIIPLWEANQTSFAQKVQAKGLTLSLAGAVSLASVIEKEERNPKEKSTIAGIFINRLSQDIELGADITLCYGLKEPYETCTPSVIARGIYDQANPYNTRIRSGLTPTPISSITDETFNALLSFRNTSYLFYLHNSSGEIFYAETNAEHEENKRLYMR